MNLPYSAESTENGTAGDTVSVVLRERLNSSTVYYYTVSAVSEDVTVTIRGTFTTPQYSKYMYVHCIRASNQYKMQYVLVIISRKLLLHNHLTGCPPMELWNLPATDATFLTDVSLLNDSAARYPSCDSGNVGSVALVNTTLTATVAYYSGTTSGSTACFVCDESSGYEPNTTITERVCQNDATWSGSPIICGMLL